ATLRTTIGGAVKPKLGCFQHLKNTVAGIPDFGLYAPDRFQKGSDTPIALKSSRGLIEVKGLRDEVAAIAGSSQVARYATHYGLVLVTNYRDFILVGRGPGGTIAPMESYRLAENEESFWELAAHPRAAAKRHGVP